MHDPNVDIKKKVENVVNEVIGEDHGTVTIPGPTRQNIPISEFTTQYFFTLAFPALFLFGTVDYMSDWAEHLLWYDDGRFAHHQYFKFVVHNLMRKSALENCNFVVNQKLGDNHLSVSELKNKINDGDNSIAKKVLYFGASLRGTTQYWSQRGKELMALIQYQINAKQGLPSFFNTGSDTISNLLENYFQNIFMKLVEKKYRIFLCEQLIIVSQL